MYMRLYIYFKYVKPLQTLWVSDVAATILYAEDLTCMSASRLYRHQINDVAGGNSNIIGFKFEHASIAEHFQ
jgi:hypothetical protein